MCLLEKKGCQSKAWWTVSEINWDKGSQAFRFGAQEKLQLNHCSNLPSNNSLWKQRNTSLKIPCCLSWKFNKIYTIDTGADPGFGQGGGPQLLRPKVADVAKRSRVSEVSILWPGSRACLRALEAFGFLMLKYAFSHILETLFLLFKTSILTPKVDKNRALDFTSINLRHSDMLHLFFNLHEKLCFNWMTWGMLSEARLKILWHGWWKIDQLCDW